MLDIEIMKWGAGIAEVENFLLVSDETVLRYYDNGYIRDEKLPLFYGSVLYKAFLQSVIEGINKIDKKHTLLVEVTCARITVYEAENYNSDKKRTWFLDEYNNIDQAKEQAITYIYNQIRG